MKTFTKTIDRFKDDNDFLIDIVIKTWFTERHKQVLESGDANRINLYNKINIEKAYKLFNTGYFKSDGYIRSTIVARDAGICFPDPKFDFLVFEKLLTEYLDPDKRLYQTGDVPEEIDLDSLKSLAQSYSSFPLTPKCYLSKINGGYALLYICDSDVYINAEYLQFILSKKYKFSQFKIEVYQSDDAQYPKEMSDDIDNLKIGKVTLVDKSLKELSVDIVLYDIKLINDLMVEKVVDLTYSGAARYDGAHKFSGVY